MSAPSTGIITPLADTVGPISSDPQLTGTNCSPVEAASLQLAWYVTNSSRFLYIECTTHIWFLLDEKSGYLGLLRQFDISDSTSSSDDHACKA